MSDLKTLKDIDPEACCHGIRAPDLKREAIKHINSWKESLKDPFTNDPEWESWMQSRIDVFKEFFNIIEEDLE